MGRTIAIGDIHGCLAPLETLPAAIASIRRTRSSRSATTSTGDSKVRTWSTCSSRPGRPLRLDSLCSATTKKPCSNALGIRPPCGNGLTLGGTDALRSYGWVPRRPAAGLADWFPEPHRRFLDNCRSYYETATHIFLHAGYVSGVADVRSTGTGPPVAGYGRRGDETSPLRESRDRRSHAATEWRSPRPRLLEVHRSPIVFEAAG